jgi:hypothetical protein
MNAPLLLTMKDVAKLLEQPAHRIIHICEGGVVYPAVEADGRGSVRRFSRDNIYCIKIALALQDLGIQLLLIKRLVNALWELLHVDKIRNLRSDNPEFDLVDVIREISTSRHPMRGHLFPPNHVVILIPRFPVELRYSIFVRFISLDSQLDWPPVAVVVNLTRLTENL